MPAMEYGNHIMLPGDPTDDSHATRRKYVLDLIGTKATLGTGTPTAVVAAASAGDATTAAPFNHVHNYSFYASAPAAVAGTAAVGTQNLPARGDHVHAYTFFATAPLALGTAAVGSANLPARGDHVHAMPTASQVGAASTTDLTNHINSTTLHLPAVTAADSNKVLTAGAAGAAPTWQVAPTGVALGTAAGTAVAATAANGSGTTAAKVDHVHNYGFDTTAPAAVGTATIVLRPIFDAWFREACRLRL